MRRFVRQKHILGVRRRRLSDVPVEVLGPAVPRDGRRRRFLHPVTGRIKRLERVVNHWLSRAVYPRVPGLYAVYEPILERGLHVGEVDLAVRGLGPVFDGLTMLLVTDVHAGPFLRAATLARAFERLAVLEPDVVLWGGDFASARVEDLEGLDGAMRRLTGRLGTFAVLGNHDHYTGDAAKVAGIVERGGAEVLHNRSRTLESSGDSVVVAGIDDWNVGRPDLDAALRGARAGKPTILLSHNPDVLFAAAERAVAVVLSGHTHGGQIRLPGLPVLVRMSRFRLDEGRYRAGGTELVVSRGLGAVGLPLRLACAPEAVRIVLRSP